MEKTRRQILECALELFGERPYDLVALADVAETSGIGLATIVRQFATKEQLFAASIQHGCSVMDADMNSTPANDLAAAVRAMTQSYERFGDAIVHVIEQQDRLPAAREVVEHGRAGHREWIARVFASPLSRLRGSARKVRLAQLMAVTDLQFWRLLRRELGLGRRDAETAVLQLLEALCR